MYDLNLIQNIDDTAQQLITLNGQQYPVLKQGTGKIPCLCIGIGSLMQKTLSSDFKKIFTVYSTDLYWIRKYRLNNVAELTLEKIIADIFSMIKQLNLKNPVLCGHSNFGIVATEAAKNPTVNISGVIMMASAPGWNQSVIQFAHQYFDKYASAERKVNDKLRKEKFLLIKKPDESEISLNYYESDSARYWGDFNITREFLEKLWSGIEVDNNIINHFFNNLLPEHDLSLDINKISVPIILIAGSHDFDSVPLSLWQQFPQPPHFTIIDCGAVGHWPNLENQQLFDNAISEWVTQYLT